MYNEKEYKKWNKKYKKFQKNNRQSVTKMVLDFNRKKSAAIAKKIKTKDIGILDERKLHTYRWNDKIFKSKKIVPEGKNHGLIMLVDCSGSMQDHNKFESSIKQCLLLVDFCRKVGIKYKVLGFGDGNGYRKQVKYKNSSSKDHLTFRHIPLLREWFSHEQSLKENDFMSTYMLYKSRHWRAGFTADGPNSSTPLIDSVLLLRQISLEFKEKENIDILNTITLTDGISNDSSLVTGGDYFGSNAVYKMSSYDPLSKSVYRTDNCNRLENILKFYKKVVGGNIIGFNLVGQHMWTSEPVVIRENFEGYDHHYTFSFQNLFADTKNKSKAKDEQESKNVQELEKSFNSKNISKTNEKILLTKFIDIIS